jgi:hypothetical protein
MAVILSSGSSQKKLLVTWGGSQLPAHVQIFANEQFRLHEQQEDMPWLRLMWTYFGVRGYQVNKKQQARPREVFVGNAE